MILNNWIKEHITQQRNEWYNLCFNILLFCYVGRIDIFIVVIDCKWLLLYLYGFSRGLLQVQLQLLSLEIK